MDISQLLTHHARYRPHHLAVVFEEHRLSYAEFNQRVNQLANALLTMGLKKGDKVATILTNSLELLELYWAVAKTGLVIVPLSPLLRGQGLTTLINDSDSVALFTSTAFIQTLNPLKPELTQVTQYILVDGVADGYLNYHELTAVSATTDPPHIPIKGDDIYNIFYSSGTTGLPKGIIHTHRIRAQYATLFTAAYRIKPESIILHTGSIIFNGAFLTLLPAFFLGATYILHKKFDPVALIDTVQREKVTHIKMVPSQIVAMLNAPNFSTKALQSLEMIGSVGAPLHQRHKDNLTKHLPERFCELYGLTEGFMTILDKYDYAQKPHSVGIPLPFFEMRIVATNGQDVPANEIGEIVGRSPLMMPGYYKRPDLTAKAIRDGWLYSGDLGYVDDDGFLYLVDRQKDMIISGGVNVYPRDIEEVIVQHPAVQEAAVFGIPSHKWGETPLAVVILKEPAAITATDLKRWINERVNARYQRIHDVVIMEDFPRSAAGKTLKRKMRAPYWADKKEQI